MLTFIRPVVRMGAIVAVVSVAAAGGRGVQAQGGKPVSGGTPMAMPVPEKRATVVQAPDSPVRIDRGTVFSTPDAPPVLLYSATNLTGDALDQFTLIAFVFDDHATLKAMQIAPARRNLDPHETKFSAMVLDGSPLLPSDVVVIGVNQAQRVNSDDWWRADIQPAAQATQQKTP
jgi:hypothetical protein